MKIARGFLVCLLFGLLLSACNSPTPAPTETITLTREATAVPAAPTITPLQPSPVPPPPTSTPNPTSTPTPTLIPPTATATLKLTVRPTQVQTKAASPRAPVSVVSSQPSDVLKSIQQANTVAQSLVNQLSSLFHGDVSLCAPMLTALTSLINAPADDVSAQTLNVQQSYALYRTAINQLNGQSATLHSCGTSGAGTINSSELGVSFRAASEAAGLLAQAWDLVRDEPGLSASGSGSPLLVAVRQVMYDSDGLGLFRIRLYLPGGTPTWAFPRGVTSFPCNDYLPIYIRIVNAPTFAVNTLSANEQAAYAKYRQAVAVMTEAGGPVAGRCTEQEGQITEDMIRELGNGGATAHELYSQAIQLLTQ